MWRSSSATSPRTPTPASSWWRVWATTAPPSTASRILGARGEWGHPSRRPLTRPPQDEDRCKFALISEPKFKPHSDERSAGSRSEGRGVSPHTTPPLHVARGPTSAPAPWAAERRRGSNSTEQLVEKEVDSTDKNLRYRFFI